MIKCIIQCADIHIRNLKRHEEYAEQLEKFINKCYEIASNYEKDEVRIIICGDIMHSKNDISNELMIFASSFLRQLAEVATVIVYSGNHDLLVNNTSRVDSLTGLFQTAQFENVTYLDAALDYKSGCIVDNNITWCLFSIHDGYNKPNIDDIKNEYPNNFTVGLYHGTITGAQLNNGFTIEGGMNGDVFEECDCVMAGDIHKHQVIKRGDTEIVYPSSLIQQTFGETITEHGFEVWNIETNTHEFINLETDYGLYDFEINDINDIDNDKEKLLNY